MNKRSYSPPNLHSGLLIPDIRRSVELLMRPSWTITALDGYGENPTAKRTAVRADTTLCIE